jgi:hypothetical protein
VDIPKQFGKKQCSRYLKTSLRPLVDGDFLYIDVDTIICDSLRELDGLDVEIGAVPDLHKNSQYYNGGVMYSKDTLTAHKLYELWHELWLEDVRNGINTDQHSLDLANKRLNAIMTIPGIWNYLIRAGLIDYLNRAKIIHYFAECKYLPMSKIEQEYSLLTLKENDGISKDIDSFIKSAKINFAYELFKLDVGVIDYSILLRRLYPHMFKLSNQFAHVLLLICERSIWLKCKLAKKRKCFSKM